MTVESIYRVLTLSHVVIKLTNGSILYWGTESGIPVDVMDREVILMRIVENRLVLTVR